MQIESKNNYNIPIKEFKPDKIEKIIGADHRMKKRRRTRKSNWYSSKIYKRNGELICK